MSDSTTREFEFVEGTSNKFWKITVEGSIHTVNYGRVGTAGQVQTKEFESTAAAETAGDKLIAEKVKKGYHETTSGATAAVDAVEPKPLPSPKGLEIATSVEDSPANDRTPADPIDPQAITRTVSLTADDYAYVGLRPRVQKIQPESPPFDREAVCKRIIEKMKHSLPDNEFQLDSPISREEAFLWIHSLSNRMGGVLGLSPQARYENILNFAIPQKVDLTPRAKTIVREYLELFYRSASLTEFASLIADSVMDTHSYYANEIIERFRTKVLPYLTDEDILSLRQTILNKLDYNAPRITEMMALLSLLGEKDKSKTWIKGLTSKNSQRGSDESLIKAILWQGDAEFAIEQMGKLNLFFDSVTLARAWLALTQCSGLERVADSVKSQSTKDNTAAMIKTVGRVLAPETAPLMLNWMTSNTAIPVCKLWLESNPEMTAAGLAPLAAEPKTSLGTAAIQVLNGLVRRGHQNTVTAYLNALPGEVIERISPAIFGDPHAEVKYEALSAEESPLGLNHSGGADSKAKPGDVLQEELPPLTIQITSGMRRLNEPQYYMLLHSLAKSTLLQPLPYVSAVKDAVTEQSRDAFAWALFQEWLNSGAPPKEKWKMAAIGLLGGDQSALKLTPLIRQWPGESQHVRAKLGIECLEAIGTDTALMQINGIAQKVPFKALKEAAIKCMEGIAKKRGLTRPELEDRIVPDCGLDERGSRVFDFGPRQFVLSVNSDMKPVLRELKDGKPLPKLLTDLPKPNLKDDPAKSEEAVADWKILKKQVAETGKIQAVRMEQGMVTGRRWSVEEFDLLLVHHPLMTNIVRLLLWGVFGDDGKLIQSFRITEDLTAADSTDDVYTIPAAAKIGVVHPLQLSDTDKNSWGEIWSDYELVPPFPQLGRPTYALTAEEAEVIDLKRFSKATLPAATLVFTLDKLAWLRGVPADAGGFNEHAKPFYSAGVTAIVNYDPGVSVGYITEGDDQNFTEVYFIPKIYVPDEMWPAHKKRVPWNEVDPVVVSEVLADLTFVASKAK